MNHDTLVHFGDYALKSLDDKDRFGGYLVRFGDAATPDLSAKRDFFTARTRFGLENLKTLPAIFHHGLDPVLDDRPLASWDFKADDVGVWVEGILSARDEYEAKIRDMARAGKLGLSSGAVAHLVRRERQANGSHFVKSWPIYEASLTPTPADPHLASAVHSLKSLFPDIAPESPTDAVPASLIDRLEGLVPDLASVKSLVADAVASRGDRGLSAAKRSKVESLALALKSLSDQWEALASPPAAVPEPTAQQPPAYDPDALRLECEATLARLALAGL